nr:tetratricopeptide repeat protein [Oceanococcus sp. HetDA_MAG_MS8]
MQLGFRPCFLIMLRIAAALATAFWLLTAHASVEDARVALERGEYQQALDLLDKQLKGRRDNAEARFLRGLTLVLLDRDEDATQAFADLVRDHPELPEPYNNLAVLYARAGKYELARDALETALIKNPSYATAHENLGDVYATLAQASWTRAEVLDRDNSMLGQKIGLIKQALSGSDIEPMQVAQRPAAKAPAAQATPTPLAATQPIVGNEPVVPQDASPAAPEPSADRAAVLDALQEWAAAWSSQDVNRYLASYSADFDPGGGLSLNTWKQQRRARLAAPTSISVQIINPQVRDLGGDTVQVQFVQVYQSNSYADQVNKVMDLRMENGAWRIVEEDVAP